MKNLVILIGRVGKAPEVRHIENGTPVANFGLATTEKYKNKAGDTIEETEWSDIVIWGNLAEVVEKYVSKGDLLYLEGKKKTRAWVDKEGNNRYSTDIICDKMQMLGGKKENAQSYSSQTKHESKSNDATGEYEDSLPF